MLNRQSGVLDAVTYDSPGALSRLSVVSLVETLFRGELRYYAMMVNDDSQNAVVPSELLEENGRLKRRVADLLLVSRVDALTGLYNRAFLLQQLKEQISLHRVRGRAIGLAVVDIDHFKKINDTYGHQAGDAALKMIAATLKDTMRASDLVGRYGGEEFVVVLEDANPEGLAIVGERIRSKIEEVVPRDSIACSSFSAACRMRSLPTMILRN